VYNAITAQPLPCFVSLVAELMTAHEGGLVYKAAGYWCYWISFFLLPCWISIGRFCTIPNCSDSLRFFTWRL